MAQTPRELTPYASLRHFFGAELRQWRQRAGLSHGRLGKQVNYSGDTIGKVEKGERAPTAQLAEACDRALGTGGALLRLFGLIDNAAKNADRSGLSVQADVDSGLAAGVTDPGGPLTDDRDLVLVHAERGGPPEIDAMNRRELLRLFSVTGTLLAQPSIGAVLGTDWIASSADSPGRLDAATRNDYPELNGHLWRVFALAPSKGQVLPLVHNQLGVLSDGLGQSHGQAVHQRLSTLVADLFQLAGEIFFDANRYTDAAYCYTLAATAAKEGDAFDLWACALTRHAFLAVYERQFAKATPMLELAAALARRGDPALSTRYWVAAVQAETSAGLGDLDACHRALEAAEQVRELPGPVHNGGWLRFDGSRLAEERGTCYVALGRPDLAETALADALSGSLTTRRRASVLTDLAMIGAQRRDPEKVLTYANAALELARQTGSGVISRKLRNLQRHLAPLLVDKQIRWLNTEITALTGQPSAG